MVLAVVIPAFAAQSSKPFVPGVFEGDVRDLPKIRPWQKGDPIRPAEPRERTHPDSELLPPVPQSQIDPLLDVQAKQDRLTVARVFTPPELSFTAQGFSGVYPPDTVGDIGSNYYIHAINSSSGSSIKVYDRASGAVVSGPFTLASLWTAGGACATGNGDPVVLYDSLASRWLLSEFASTGNHLCVYVSRNNDPVTGGWLNYDFATPNFPDYPKYAVWPDGYYVTTNESSPSVYALDRASMLAGLPATSQRFTATSLSGFGFQTLTPADIDGPAVPPAGSPAFFVRHKDDEANPPSTPGSDRIEVWQLQVDWTTPANSTFSLASSLSVAEFDSSLCGTTSTACFAQPGTTQTLDPLREVVMWRAQYRNFSSYQTLLGSLVTDVNGADRGGGAGSNCAASAPKAGVSTSRAPTRPTRTIAGSAVLPWMGAATLRSDTAFRVLRSTRRCGIQAASRQIRSAS